MNNMRRKSKFQERLDVMVNKYNEQRPSTQNDPSSQSAQIDDKKIFSVKDIHNIIHKMKRQIIPTHGEKAPWTMTPETSYNEAIYDCIKIIEETINNENKS